MIDVFLESEIKLNISIDPIGTTTMDDYDFSVEAFTSEVRVVTFSKQQMHRVDSNNYIVIVDTTLVGPGRLMVRVIAHVPDTDMDAGTRREIEVIDTEINIKKKWVALPYKCSASAHQ